MARRTNPGTHNDEDRGRFSARRKTAAVLRLLRGEELDTLSRELGVTAATLSSWRDRFLLAGQASLKSRAADLHDDELRSLQAKIGALTMENELLYDRCHALEGGRPFGRRTSGR